MLVLNFFGTLKGKQITKFQLDNQTLYILTTKKELAIKKILPFQLTTEENKRKLRDKQIFGPHKRI